MSITDELRRVALEELTGAGYDIACEIADRIDKTHAKSLDQCDAHWQDVIDKQHALVDGEHPKDLNGSAIRVGDRVKVMDEPPARVVAAVGKDIVVYDLTAGGMDWACSNNCVLVEPDTQEKIDADTYLDECTYFDGNDGRSCERCPNYEDKSGDCLNDMIQDLLRRQRTLDGVK